MKPLIGITTDLIEVGGTPRSAAAMAYIRAVAEAGGVPILLPPVVTQVPEFIRRCDAFVLIGGKDADTEPFGEARHPKSDPVNPDRQAFDTALLRALRDERPEAPALGVCLGMQMMALVAGGRINQHLPETLPTHERHRGDNVHAVIPVEAAANRYHLTAAPVCSNHRQAVQEPGGLIVLAQSDDHVIEAVADPSRPFYLGVQWHPERTRDGPLGTPLFRGLVSAARGRA